MKTLSDLGSSDKDEANTSCYRTHLLYTPEKQKKKSIAKTCAALPLISVKSHFFLMF